jgi:hypothetical protein
MSSIYPGYLDVSLVTDVDLTIANGKEKKKKGYVESNGMGNEYGKLCTGTEL